MKIKPYIQFINENQEWLDSRQKISTGLYEMKVAFYNYVINEDLSVDIMGSINIANKGLTSIPIQFGDVMSDFKCQYNKLTSLKGSPKIVGNNLECAGNLLTNLIGCSKQINDCLDVSKNPLETLEGCSENIGQIVYIRELPKPLESLDGYYLDLDYLSFILNETENVETLGKVLESTLEHNPSYIVHAKKGINRRKNIEHMPDSFNEKFGYLLEFDYYTKSLK